MTDTDKINIVSSQVVFKLSSFRMDARSGVFIGGPLCEAPLLAEPP